MDYISKRYKNMAPYVPGEQPRGREYIKLNTNESPFSPAPGVIEAINKNELQSLNLYPDPDCNEAAAAIGAGFGLKKSNLLLTNGSDEILAFCFQAYCDKDTPAVYADITYGFYKVFAKAYCVKSKVIPLREDFTLNPENYYNAKGTVFIANPNAPTGIAISVDEIEGILKNNKSNIVVIDEAYVDFGAKSAYTLIDKYKNLIVTQTMSKSRSLAGGRVGYAISCEERIRELSGMKFSFNPYSLNRLSLLAAQKAMEDKEYFNECINSIIKNRAYLTAALKDRGFCVLDSCCNFIFAKPGDINGGDYYAQLKEKGVLVRHFGAERIKDYVRITIGTLKEIDELLKATDEILK